MSLLSSLSRRGSGIAESRLRLSAVVLAAACLVAFAPAGGGLSLNATTVETGVVGCGLLGFLLLSLGAKRRV
jgi:hypothetical protein